jgi:hypothetical protein
MAEPDHTVLARLQGPTVAPYAHLPGFTPASVAKGEKTQWDIHCEIVEVEEVRFVIKLLLGESEDLDGVVSRGALARPHSWPLPAATYASRLVATHFLNQCADLRRHGWNG